VVLSHCICHLVIIWSLTCCAITFLGITFMVLKHQGYTKHSYLEYINNTTPKSTYGNYNNNTHNSRIVKQDKDTFSTNQNFLIYFVSHNTT
jgi:hypothetical protein